MPYRKRAGNASRLPRLHRISAASQRSCGRGTIVNMKAANYKPDGFHTLTPYFAVKGAAEFIDFVKNAFGAEELSRYEHGGRIMHAELRIGDSMIEAGEAPPDVPPRIFGIHMYVEDSDAAYGKAIAAGCKSLRPMTDQFYGDREGNVEDKWGNHWYIATRKETLTTEEMDARTASALKK